MVLKNMKVSFQTCSLQIERNRIIDQEKKTRRRGVKKNRLDIKASDLRTYTKKPFMGFHFTERFSGEMCAL